jgi:hypothetical protein
MNIINDTQWFFYNDPINHARDRDTRRLLSRDQFQTVVFEKPCKFYLPLIDNDTVEMIQLQSATVVQILSMVDDFYRRPLLLDTVVKVFAGVDKEFYDAWHNYRQNVSYLQNYHLLNDSSSLPQFRGIEEFKDGYLVLID